MTSLPSNRPAYCKPVAFDAFLSALPEINSSPGLFRAAFAISLHEWPTASLAEAEATVDKLAEAVRSRVKSSAPQAVLAHLHDVLFDVVGFRGNADDYYNPANSYVGNVLHSHLGIPISLVLVYQRVANELGLRVLGINAPGHFLAGVEIESSEPNSAAPLMYVDPFYGGGILTEGEVFQRIEAATGQSVLPEPGLLARATPQQWLARMLHNLQAIFAQQGRQRDQLAMEEIEQILTQFAANPSQLGPTGLQ